MRTVTKTQVIYKFDELPENIKETVLNNFREQTLDDFCIYDGMESLKAYCAHFGITITRWQIGAFCHSYVCTDMSKENFRGLKLKNYNGTEGTTSYYIESYCFETFYEEFKATGNALLAFECGLERGIQAIVNDCEQQYEDESIIASIEANEYEFYENGDLA